MNHIVLLGRLTKDVDVRYTANSKVVATFTLAVDKFENGEKSASFIPCVAFGKTAEAIGNFVSKADRLLVEGSLNTRSYDDKTGQKHYVTEVLVNRMDFIERKEKSAPSGNSANEGGFESMGAIEDIPF
jgi:single-strand DNA-binding protein